MRDLQPNDILNQRYRLVRVVGVGTFGTIWSAEHLALGSMVAVKVLESSAVRSEELRDRFFREAWAATALRSQHVVHIIDCGVDVETPYIVMELFEGESLEERLGRRERLDAPETEQVLRQVARAMDRAHAIGIVHRDLKPGNIFIQTSDGDEIIKVFDFGVAKTKDSWSARVSTGMTPVGVVLGTPQYMSPEQVCGASDLDHRSDIWALGMIAFECLVGRTAFEEDNVGAVLDAILNKPLPVPSELASVPAGFDRWFAQACARRPADRFGSGRAAAEEFERLCSTARPGQASTAASTPTAGVDQAEASRSQPPKTPTLPLPLVRKARAPASLRMRANYRWVLVGALFLAATGGVSVLAMQKRSAHADTKTRQAKATPEPANRPLLVTAEEVRAEPAASTNAVSKTFPQPADAEAEPTNASTFEAAASTKPQVAPRLRSAAPKRSVRSDRRALGARGTSHETPREDCNPPWVFDEEGRARARPECL